MRLKSLKLAGFKSFANVTTFTFPRGITAIVGPNGCGKSNVIDAIRWVLGETSAKQLRGGAMSDVIFAGTQDKSAKSVASVELTFEHTQDEQTGIRHEFNLYHELSVRRQVNLDGRSDYFINGTRARRRDVVDVFLGTGLGARSYAVIEQGMIGRIVDSSPMQLREFIEEAAGVSRYQARRIETQKKLSRTEDNLARLHDMQSELVRQQKSLARQATSAQRYNELNETLADTKQQLAIQQLYQAKQAQLQHKSVYEQSATEATELQTRYEQLKSKQDKLSTQINQEQWLKDEAQSAHYQQQLSCQQTEYELNDITAKVTAIKQQLADLDRQRQQSTDGLDRLKTEQAEQQLALDCLQPELAELSKKRQTYQADEQLLQRAWSESQTQLARLQDNARTLEQQQAINNQAQKRHHLGQDKLASRQQSWQTLWDQSQTQSLNNDGSLSIDAQAKSVSSVIDELEAQLQQRVRQQDSVAERLADLQPQAHTLQQRLTEQLRQVTAKEKSHALLAGEYDTLHKIVHAEANEKPTAPTDKTDKGLANNVAIENESLLSTATLREQIELSELGQQHAQILDNVLALWLDSQVLVQNQIGLNSETALYKYVPNLLSFQHNQINHSKQNEAATSSHSLWLPATKNDSANKSFISELPADLEGKVLPLSSLITKPNLAIWQQCYLYIADNKTSSEITAELTEILKVLPPSAWVLTAEGWLISEKGTINFSQLTKQKNATQNSHFLTQRLQQQQRLMQLEELLDKSDEHVDSLHKQMKRSQSQYDTLKISLDESRAQSEQLTRAVYDYQQQLATEKAALKQKQADAQRLQSERLALESEQQELVAEQKGLDDEREQIETDLQIVRPKIQAAQDRRQQLQGERNELQRNRQNVESAWQTLQLRQQKDEMRLEHSVNSLERATKFLDESWQNRLALIASLDSHQQQLLTLQATLQAIKAKRDDQQDLLAAREVTLTALKDDYNEQQSILDTLQTNLQAQQDTNAKQATELALSESKLNDASENVQHALDRYQQILANRNDKDPKSSESLSPMISVSNLLTDFIIHERRVRPEKIAELQAEQADLEQKISKIGAVNLAAVAELAEVNERLEPLAQQTEDIAASMQTLTAAIASIDETTKALFMQTLESVNVELSKLFAKVFGGGQASLTLDLEDMAADTNSATNADITMDKSEHWRAGLTLMAQPKGKRNSRLAVLSGGEKTLTALSLIFAIFKQHPAPFCVLDEVDAPLDDANVGRFTSLITELADDLQFIFISHNKLSMQIADELKGITMPSAGISTLVSVSLDEAEKYIES
ncbi:chromosome segregation protein SMC [Psychrobacter sp. 2Y5]|uniref:chromosome segregation protein SMC n=1 Tax=unclassified Psychrobacter TaxID=196806 RepID=UPI003F44AB74